MNETIEPVPIPKEFLTKEGQKYLSERGCSYSVIYAFQKGDKTRVVQLSQILKNAIGVNLGKVYDIEEPLAIELKKLLSAVCYLFNSTSFREGKYFDFDKIEVDTKLGRKNAKNT